MGHMSVDCNGPQCACGNRGCLELYCSTPNIIRNVEQTCGVRVTGMEQAAELAMTNKTAFAVLYDAVRHLACGINNYLNLIDVSLVILGHDAYYLPDELVDVMRQTVAQTNVSIHRREEPPCFVKSSFGSLAPLYGSICVVLQQIFQRGYENFGTADQKND
jgi:predicted NBD/HSP70 family sugar kinase